MARYIYHVIDLPAGSDTWHGLALGEVRVADRPNESQDKYQHAGKNEHDYLITFFTHDFLLGEYITHFLVDAATPFAHAQLWKQFLPKTGQPLATNVLGPPTLLVLAPHPDRHDGVASRGF
jgi:hypothetical protein